MSVMSFRNGFSADRLKAFETRFEPSSESLTRRISNLAITAGLYAAIVAAAVGLGTSSVAGLVHALHLGGL